MRQRIIEEKLRCYPIQRSPVEVCNSLDGSCYYLLCLDRQPTSSEFRCLASEPNPQLVCTGYTREAEIQLTSGKSFLSIKKVTTSR
jgi:hypothetical protein